MSKKALNQNSKYVQELIDFIEPDFIFNDKPKPDGQGENTQIP